MEQRGGVLAEGFVERGDSEGEDHDCTYACLTYTSLIDCLCFFDFDFWCEGAGGIFIMSGVFQLNSSHFVLEFYFYLPDYEFFY